MKLSKLCNLRCTYCYEYNDLGKRERMPLEGLDIFFANLVDYIKSRQDFRRRPHFILHGGEALLLPHDYLRSVIALQKKHLEAASIEYTTSIQSNLVAISDQTLDLLKELNINLGISIDVFGGQRVDAKGIDSQEIVLKNLQRIIDKNINFGAIMVLHNHNIAHAIPTYNFFNRLGINYRILPIFSQFDPPERIKPLMITHDQTVGALTQVAAYQFSDITQIRILPIWDFFKAAVHYLTNNPRGLYDPAEEEWAYIVNTDGDIYNHGDSYTLDGLMGNVFNDSLVNIRSTDNYKNTLKIRYERMEACRSCRFDGFCNQLPIAEANTSERMYDSEGNLQCSIAKPMIEFMVQQIRASESGRLLMSMNGEDPSREGADALSIPQ